MLKELSQRYGINEEAAAKWRKRHSVEDIGPGPQDARSMVPATEEEVVIVALRKHPPFTS